MASYQRITFYLQSDAIKQTLHPMNRSLARSRIDMRLYEEVSQVSVDVNSTSPSKKFM